MSSNEWQPSRGERVIAVLPDGHEIEGEYLWDTSAADRVGRVHCVRFSNDETAWVRTVKPLPVTEPTAFGARVVDGEGQRWIRDRDANGNERRAWWSDNADERDLRAWSELPQPVTVVDADPDWGDAQ